MKFDRRAIMKAAWYKHNRFGMDLSTALRMAWYDAKAAAPIWSVYGDGKLVASGLTFNRAGEVEHMCKFNYWNTAIKAA